jgi:hypothetical protein
MSLLFMISYLLVRTRKNGKGCHNQTGEVLAVGHDAACPKIGGQSVIPVTPAGSGSTWPAGESPPAHDLYLAWNHLELAAGSRVSGMLLRDCLCGLCESLAFLAVRSLTRSAHEEQPGAGPALAFPVWQHRFYDFVVFTAKKRVEKLHYMHQNPMKRGLVLEPEQWRWSSYVAYALEQRGPVLVNEKQKIKLEMRKIS